MDMGTSTHSTPVGNVSKQDNNLHKTWIAFLMYSGQKDGVWSLSFDYKIGNGIKQTISFNPDLLAYPSHNKWIQSFKYDELTYYLVLSDPLMVKEGQKKITALVNKKESATSAYRIFNEEKFIIEIDPRMPDMDNHASPDNKSLEYSFEKDIYEGSLNLTMTGLWRINIIIKDLNGNIIAGSVVDGENSSKLYWDVTI